MPKPHAMMNLEKSERFYKFFFFRPYAGRHKQFEYRIFTTVDEQIEFLKSAGRADVSYLH